ncbi:hypothetical protein B0O99DRAFT_677508 [Bisporella sp. PMI_857]|nr:hypothetical protein B0O99DRAFT_677508 [Bisporella sp. PMI_857]
MYQMNSIDTNFVSSLLQGTSLPFEAQTTSPIALSASSRSEVSSSEEDEDDDASSQGEKQRLARIRAAVADIEGPSDTQLSTVDTWMEDQDQSTSICRPPTSEMPQLMDSLRFTLGCLYRIPIRRPTSIDRLKKLSSIDLSHFEPFDSSYVAERCPTASEVLKQRLKVMISNRRRVLNYRARHYKNIKPTVRVVQGPLMEPGPDLPRIEAFHQRESNQSEVQSSRPSQVSKATTFKPDDFPYPPPDLFSPDDASVAESTPSSTVSSWTGSQKLYVPPRPKPISGGNAFLCPYCFVICKAKSDHTWKHHVLRDLEPYICTFGNCDMKDQQFEHRDEWYEHELQHHRIEWCCNAEYHPPYATRLEFLDHLKSHHPELRLAIQTPDMIKRFQRPKQEQFGVCPFCAKSSKKLKSHVSRHMEQLALYVLGGNNQEDSDIESNTSSGARIARSNDTWRSDDSSLDWEVAESPSLDRTLAEELETEDPLDQAIVPDAEDPDWDMVIKFPTARRVERLVIGIDYGTIYTGVAFCHSGPRSPTIDDIQLIADWPGRYHNAPDKKVSSEVAYFDQQFEWGSKIAPHRERHAWTKLLLDESQRDTQSRLIQEPLGGDEEANDANIAPLPIKEPVEIATDFLSGVRTHLQSVLEARYGKLLKLLQQEVVITVPAVWSDMAKISIYEAVCNAGFTAENAKVSMMTEPEAAAIYILNDIKDSSFSNVRPGDHFVVCDAGGVVVNTITYRVDSVSPNLIIKEAVVGTGAKCGSVFVDREFKLWLRRKLGIERFRKIRKNLLNAGSRLMNDFEKGKIFFEGDDMFTYVWMPPEIGGQDDPTLDLVDHEIRIPPEAMREIFDPCVNQILTLIDGQIGEVMSKSANVKYIFLAGGFGSSKFLFQRMKERYTEREIEVIRPYNPWSAVVLGAVIAKLNLWQLRSSTPQSSFLH